MNTSNHDVYILDAVRTPVGRTFRGLKDFTAPQMAALAIRAMLARGRVDPGAVSEVILGNTVAAGIGQNMARQAGCLAGLPYGVPAFTVNNVCGSGLQSVILAAQAAACGHAPLVITGGAESASHCPHLLSRAEDNACPVDSLVHDGLWCQITGKHMGELAEETAAREKISRRRQDEYALSSHRKACRAMEQGFFAAETAPVESAAGKTLSADERPRKHIDMRKLAELPPAFVEGGTVTSGNAPAAADGAAVLLVAGEKTVKETRADPLARVVAFDSFAGDPRHVFTAGAPSIRRCLEKAGCPIKEVDLFEVTEAFAVQSVYTQRALDIPDEKFNVFGGDVALGHPLGAAGARAMVTLLHALRTKKKRRGLVSVCLGGGGAISLLVERAS